MKKLSAILLIVFLTGCNSYDPYVRLEQRILVQLFGVDYDPEKSEYTVSLQYSMGKTSDASKSENDLATVTGRGGNLYSAVKQARTGVGKEFFFTQNQVLILGESVIQNDPVKAIEDYLTYCDDYSNAYVAGVHGTAEEVISMTFKDEYSDKNKVKIVLENANNNGIFPVFMIYETLMNSYSTSGSCFIPMLNIADGIGAESESEKKEKQSSQDEESDTEENSSNESGDESGGGESGDESGNSTAQEKNVVPGGGVIVMDGEVVMTADETACKGLSLLANTSDISSVDFLYEGVDTTIELFKKRTKIIPSFDSDSQKLTVKVDFFAVADKAYNRLLEKTDDYESQEKSGTEEVIKNLVKDEVVLRMESIAKPSAESGCDVINLEDSFKHYNSKSWLKVEDKWSEVIKNAEFVYSIKIKIQ